MKNLNYCIAIGTLSLVPAVGSATILHFDGLGLSNYGDIPSGLGAFANSAVTGVSQGSAWTPNVDLAMSTVDGTGALNTANLDFWNTGYGDLTDVAFPVATGLFGRVTLTAASGYFVTINSFDLAGYFQADLAADRIRIYDGSGNVLWNQDSTTVLGSGASHSSYAPSITSQTLILEYGNNWNIGLDNLNFSQSSSVPEPMTFGVLGIGVLGMLRRRRSH